MINPQASGKHVLGAADGSAVETGHGLDGGDGRHRWRPLGQKGGPSGRSRGTAFERALSGVAFSASISR